MAETRNKEYVHAATKEYVHSANMTGLEATSVNPDTLADMHTVDELAKGTWNHLHLTTYSLDNHQLGKNTTTTANTIKITRKQLSVQCYIIFLN